MKTLEYVAMAIGLIATGLGIIGGLISLPESFRRFRKELQPHGNKGANFCVVSRRDTDRATFFTILVVDDLFHFITSMAKPENNTRITSIEQIGDYYKVEVELPPGRDFYLTKTKKSDK